MPRMLVWVAPGIVAWAVLQIIAVQWLTGWREEKARYGFIALGLFAWWLPNLVFGESGAPEVEQGVLIVGFPVAAIYLAVLLIAELVERRNSKGLKADG
jgi:hypothetical protein